MGGSGCAFFVTILVLLLFSPHHADAIEITENGVLVMVAQSSPVANLSGAMEMAPPDLGKRGKGERKAEDQNGGSEMETKKEAEKDESKEAEGEVNDKPLEDPKVEDEEKGKGRPDGRSDAKTLPVVVSGVDGCDPANRCIDEKNKYVACLRVPGTDYLALSLLIQNKGTGALDVNIIASDFVTLEQDIVQIPAKQDKEVKVSVRDGANDTIIVLKAGDGNCSVDFQNMISNNIKKSETSALPRRLGLSMRSSILCIFLVACVLINLVWACIRFWKGSSPKYQKVEVGLPVSTGGKKEADESDSWDNSWGEIWDDEETPMTPSKPAANPSLKGLASRRYNRDGWKD